MALSLTKPNITTATSLSIYHTMKPVGKMVMGEEQKVKRSRERNAKGGAGKNTKRGSMSGARDGREKK